MMLLTTLALILGISFGKIDINMDFDVDRCLDMKEPLCVKIAADVYNYTVPEIRSMTTVMRMITERRIACKIAGHCPTLLPAKVGARVPCTGGSASGYSCNNIDLLAFVPLSGPSNTVNLGASSNANGNDIWGWTDLNDPAGGVRRYAITGQTESSSIVDVTDPENPSVLCRIPSRVSINTSWRDIKVAYTSAEVAMLGIVADRSGQGLQYVNIRQAITKCRGNRVAPQPYNLVEGVDFGWVGTGVYTGGTNTHNIVGLDGVQKNGNIFSTGNSLFLVGSNSCSGGLLQVDYSSGVPQFGGCYSSDGYTHDAECWTYNGPDTRYTGRDICVGYNENSITIVDYTNRNSPQMISRTTYSGSSYTHQGWRTSDESYLLMNDELDESRGTVPSQTTYVVKITNLQNPQLLRWYSGINSIDHNLYIKEFCDSNNNCVDYAFEANYRAGLRLLKVDMTNFDEAYSTGSSSLAQSLLTEVGFFKTYGGTIATSFNGMWSNYPYFNDPNNPGLVVCQDIETGLFVLDVCDAIPECVDFRDSKRNVTTY